MATARGGDDVGGELRQRRLHVLRAQTSACVGVVESAHRATRALKRSSPVLFGGARSKYGSASKASRRRGSTTPRAAVAPSSSNGSAGRTLAPQVEQRVGGPAVEADRLLARPEHGQVGDAAEVEHGDRLHRRDRRSRDGTPARAVRPGRRRRRRGCGSRRRRRCRSARREAPARSIASCSRCRRIRPGGGGPSGHGSRSRRSAATASGCAGAKRLDQRGVVAGERIGGERGAMNLVVAGAIQRGELERAGRAKSRVCAWARTCAPGEPPVAVEVDDDAVDAVERRARHQADEERAHRDESGDRLVVRQRCKAAARASPARDAVAPPATRRGAASAAASRRRPSWTRTLCAELAEARLRRRRERLPPPTSARPAADPAGARRSSPRSGGAARSPSRSGRRRR